MDTAALTPTERRNHFRARIREIEAVEQSAVAELQEIHLSKKAGTRSPIAENVKAARAVARSFLNGNTPPFLVESRELGREEYLVQLRNGADIALHEFRRLEGEAAYEESVIIAQQRREKLIACCRNAVLAAITFEAAKKQFDELTSDLVVGVSLPCAMSLGVYGETIIEAIAGDRFEHVIRNAIDQQIISESDARKARNAARTN